MLDMTRIEDLHKGPNARGTIRHKSHDCIALIDLLKVHLDNIDTVLPVKTCSNAAGLNLSIIDNLLGTLERVDNLNPKSFQLCLDYLTLVFTSIGMCQIDFTQK